MVDNKVPIIYLSGEELNTFSIQEDATVFGHSYEWEGERVVHLRIHPVLHSYGAHGKSMFSKIDICNYDNSVVADVLYFVQISSNGSIQVFEHLGDEWQERDVNFIPSQQELYSRNKGILEINILENKRVMIVGLGSFGSQIAIELAKAGVGSFSLFDFDRVELHNLARHTCTINDLGRLKTDAIYDAIKGKNPYAIVDKYPIDINDDLQLLNEEIAKSDLVICSTDNNKSRFNISEALVKQKHTGIFGRAVTRAEGGDVFRYRPGGPCYCCLIGAGFYDPNIDEITDVASARRDGRIPAYASEEDANAMVQVGLSADIEPICNMMVKLSLMELSRGSNSGIKCLESELVYDYYMWANRRERRHASWAPLPNAANRPTILRWYGARIPKDDQCPLCSKKNIALESGEEFEKGLGDNLEGVDINELL